MGSETRDRAGGGEPAPYLRIEGVTKKFGDFTALKDISLDIYESEFVCFLGPSGCGKTTLLRAIAGLDIQTSGRVFQGGRDISTLPPSQRDFGIVFQSYALFPNLTVVKNVGYGLVNRKMKKGAIAARVEELLELVGLPDQGEKYPAQLSGGQQQRVALARALATSPSLLLLDEPLSALDAKVRVYLRREVKELQRRLNITTIMVTHDQEEALTMADRIVVMDQGVIDQVGTPFDIYSQPENPFVADFIGTMNFLPGVVSGNGRVRLGEEELSAGGETKGLEEGTPVTVCVRPEDISIWDKGGNSTNRFQASITNLEFLGSFYRANLSAKGIGEEEIKADLPVHEVRSNGAEKGMKVTLTVPEERIRIFLRG